jgi:hypothetical protein
MMPLFKKLFKKSKKSRPPTQQPVHPGNPTHTAVGALGDSANLESDSGRESTFRSGWTLMGVDLTIPPGTDGGSGSGIVSQNSGVGQRPIGSGVLTPTPGHEDGDTRGCIPLADVTDVYDPDSRERARSLLECTKRSPQPQHPGSLLRRREGIGNTGSRGA